MMRQWFINGEGIDRHVISADIQRYLGNDATVRPGVGSGEFQVRTMRYLLGRGRLAYHVSRASKGTGSRHTATSHP